MTVFRRKTPSGLTEKYYYKFQVGGKLFRGPTPYTVEKEAAEWEANEKRRVLELDSKGKVLEQIRRHVVGDGVQLSDAWAAFLQVPRKKQMADGRQKLELACWNDFLAYMADRYPEIGELNGVSREMAEEYIQHIRTKGRWVRTISFRRKGKHKGVAYKSKAEKLSASTANNYLQVCRKVCKHLERRAGLAENPFGGIEKLDLDTETREAFTLEQLEKIEKAATGWMYSLFLTGINTGLREGDICRLTWENVDLENGWLDVVPSKTSKKRVKVRIPMFPALREHLETLPGERKGPLFPELARRYKTDRSGLSKQITAFLSGLEIETTREVPGRSRRASVRDVHSLRHTFAYLAGMNGWPFPLVQSILGHMSPEMTKLYMSHATDAEKAKLVATAPSMHAAMKQLPPPAEAPAAEDVLAKVRAELEAMTAKNWKEKREAALKLLDGGKQEAETPNAER